MPIGVYTVMDGKGNPVGTEEFRCAPGPAGWRYFAAIETSVPEPHRETVDLVVDLRWLPVRLRIDTGSHHVDLAAEETRLQGERDGEPLEIEWEGRLDLDYLSPSFNAVTANRLGRTEEIRVVYLDPVTCEPHVVRQRYELGGNEEVSTPVGRFQARRWQYTGLDSGWTGSLWVAGDIVVAFQNVFELAAYEPGPRGPFPIR
ncbi:MAG: putative glycolipid-binding domain-containing protein [Actinomycetota bacterium]